MSAREVVAPPSYEPTSDLLFLPAGDGFLYVYELEKRRFLGRFSAQPHPGVPPIVLHPFVFIPERQGGRTQLVRRTGGDAAGGPATRRNFVRCRQGRGRCCTTEEHATKRETTAMAAGF